MSGSKFSSLNLVAPQVAKSNAAQSESKCKASRSLKGSGAWRPCSVKVLQERLQVMAEENDKTAYSRADARNVEGKSHESLSPRRGNCKSPKPNRFGLSQRFQISPLQLEA